MSDSQLAKKTIRRVTEALDRNQTGAISEIVQIVRKLSGQAAHVSIGELSDLIGRDPTITNKVIGAANTFGYNPSGIPIITITEAIHTVGFERIRNLTLSLMLAESAGLKLNNEEQREMAALAVCSGMLAQTLVGESHHLSIDPEMAFVGASLRNYGKLLMSTFFIDEYLEARSIATSKEPDEAYQDVFGITPLDLGHTLLKSTNLPETIMASLQKVPKDLLSRSAYTSEEEILVAAELCVRVCEVAFDERISPENFDAEIGAIIQTYGKTFPVDLDLVHAALATVDTMMSQLNQIIGVRDESCPASIKLRARAAGKKLLVRARPRKTPVRPADSSEENAVSPERAAADEEAYEAYAENSFQNATARVERMLAGEDAPDLGEACAQLCQAILDSLGLDSCIAFLPDEFDAKRQRYASSQGVGPLFGKVKNRPLVSPENKDIFSICLGRREDILIQDTKAGKIVSVIPDWIHAKGDVNSVIVLPASVEKRLFAIFLGTVTHGSPISLGANDLRRLRSLRAQLGRLRAFIDQGGGKGN